MSQQHGPLDELVRMLWGSGSSARLLQLPDPVPAGHVVADHFRVLPTWQRPRLLLPLDVPAAARMRLLNVARGPRQSEPVPHTGIDVKVVVPGAEAGLTLKHLAADIVGSTADALVISTSIVDVAGDLWPTVSVAGLDGAPRMVLKVASRTVHRNRLGQEYAALEALHAVPAPGIHTPAPMFDLDWHGRRVTGVDAPAANARAVTVAEAGTIWSLLSDLQASQPMALERLAQSAWWTQLRERATAVATPLRVALASQFSRVTAHFGSQYYAMGRVHGDWLPRNLAWTADGRLCVRGWEHSHRAGPLLLDPLHWRYGVPTPARGRALPHGVHALRQHVARISAAPPGLAAVFLAEHAVRRAEEVRPEVPATREVAIRALRALAETDVIGD